MTLEAAIEILEQHLNTWGPDRTGQVFYAMQLGIEALKAVKLQHSHIYVVIPRLLPGETEENG